MYQEILIGSSKVVLSSSAELFTKYYMIRQPDICLEDEYFDAYGLRVTASQKKNGIIECEEIPFVSTDREEMEALCYTLILNQVTPVSLRDIIDDYIS